jgi:hypothetical protein
VLANIHHVAAPLVAVVALVLLAIVVVGAIRHRPVRFASDRAILLALGLVSVGIVTGLAILVSGGAPADPLHFVYAVVALAVLPAVRFWDRLARRRAVALAIGAVVLAALMLRLFQTG